MGLTERHWFENEDVPENYERDLEDAVYNSAMLKEQEAVKPVKQIEQNEWTVCGNCHNHLISKWTFCPYCGKAVNWE